MHTNTQMSPQKQRSSEDMVINHCTFPLYRLSKKLPKSKQVFFFQKARSLEWHQMQPLQHLRACLALLSHQVTCSCRWNSVHQCTHWTVHSCDTIHTSYSPEHQSTSQPIGFLAGSAVKGLYKSLMSGSGIWAFFLSEWKGISEIKASFGKAQKRHHASLMHSIFF